MGMTIERGKEGEEWAVDFLRARGYHLVETNFRWRGGEIDLICRDGRCLAFVEVKTRRSLRFGSPEEALTPEKRARLIRTAEKYLAEHPAANELEVRFDVVALSGGEARLYRNAFTLDERCSPKR